MSSASSNLQLWKEYRIPLVCLALGVATLSIILSNKNNGSSDDSNDSPKDKKTKVDKIVKDMEQDSTIPDLSQEATARVAENATADQKPLQHQGLKKADFRKLPKIIRKKPKKKQAELDAAAAAAAPVASGCCGGKKKPEGDSSAGCCGGKNKSNGATADDSVVSSGCACSSTTEQIPAAVMAKIDPLLLPELIEPMKIFFSTITGTAKVFAQQLAVSAVAYGLPQPKLIDIVDYDTEDFLTESSLSIFLLSTYNVEGPNDWFLKWLEDTRFDWRVQKESLNKLKFSVFGLGDSAYGEEFCNGPRSADKWLGQMGAQRVWPFGEGDKNGGKLIQCLT